MRSGTELFRKIDQFEVERDWLKKDLNNSAYVPKEKRAMIEQGHRNLPIKRRCELLALPRSSAYYRSSGESARNLDLMDQIDRIYTERPFYASRQMRDALRLLSWKVGRKRVRRLMRLMGLAAQCPKPNLSKPAPRTRQASMRSCDARCSGDDSRRRWRSRVVHAPADAWCSGDIRRRDWGHPLLKFK